MDLSLSFYAIHLLEVCSLKPNYNLILCLLTLNVFGDRALVFAHGAHDVVLFKADTTEFHRIDSHRAHYPRVSPFGIQRDGT
ncbi:hypothetical protein JRQ81_019100 [Phrynocephalus forsythii]|uniref:Uncharacterized protein n=1 Tax=Phrynocephalus forsythii TaxID=171643 RepID=A0A9Q0XLR6_9SAUR|nr:hypothetical protein JRQ81_019100 [Phrynocephalus forsythii]